MAKAQAAVAAVEDRLAWALREIEGMECRAVVADSDRVFAIADRIALLFADSDRVFAIADRIDACGQ